MFSATAEMLTRAGRGTVRSVALATVLFAASGVVQAQDAALSSSGESGDHTPGPGAMFFDLVFGRPLGLAATAVGTAVFVAALPFEVISNNYSGPAQKLIVDPAHFTFTRPLGEIH